MYRVIFCPISSIFILALLLVLSACSSETPWATIDVSGFRPNLAFILTEVNHSEVVQAKNFHSQAVALNFGFTHCPDVCPLSLHQMHC